VGTQGKPFVPTDMGLVLNKVLANLNSEIESSKAVVTHDPMPSIVADSAQMTQVFQYLIDNSIKFRSEATPQIHVSAKEQDSEWVFSVSDNGMGIMPEFKERIFVLFQRLHGVEFGGTGIGLPVCKKIVERHGGRIWVESVPGKGSTFYFAIPKEIPEEEPTAGPAAGA
jgi:light-regulated signal transduction histidine kinase (bacteriophytochrome)